MHRKKVERELGCEFISLGVCAISLSKGNANESCVPALRLDRVSCLTLLYYGFVLGLGPEAEPPTWWRGGAVQRTAALEAGGIPAGFSSAPG